MQQALNHFGGAAVLPQLRRLQLQIASVVLVSFLTLLLYTIYLLVNAAYNLAPAGTAACFADSAPFQSSFYQLPELQVLMRSLEACVALLVALWGMTSDRTWELMKQNKNSKDGLLHVPEAASRMKSQLLG